MSARSLVNHVRQAARRHILDALDERGLARGLRLEIPKPKSCILKPFEEAMPGTGELLVETMFTAISVGTERAIYLALPNVIVSYPYSPGYSSVGRVLRAGARSSFQPGEVVVTGGAHASLSLCASRSACRVPEGVPYEAAAITQIAGVAMLGVREAAIRPGDRVVVLGAGLIGQLAAQLARLAGADVTLAARSPARLAIAQAAGLSTTLATGGNRAELAQLRADLVLEVSGAPDGIQDALVAAAPEGRVVLLGSPRGVTTGLDLRGWQAAGVVVLGAHTQIVRGSDESSGTWTWHHECEAFLRFLAEGRLNVAPLLNRRATPDEAPKLYESLARPGDDAVGVILNWTAPGPWRAHVETASPLRLAAAGVRYALGRTRGRTIPSTPRGDGRVVRFGLIGCGEIAAETAEALRAARNAALAFAADPDIELARSLAAASGAQSTTDMEFLLASSDVDAVVISTPHHLHAELAIRAVEAGKHVVVEKPMATHVEDCDRMIAAARRRGVLLSVCYCHRFDPQVQFARRLVDGGCVGELLGTRISFAQCREAAYFERGLTGRTSSDWRSKRKTAGGGVLIMNACHLLDVLGWLAAVPVVDVAAHVATLVHNVEVEDTAAASLRYANGALGTLDATTAMVGPWLTEQQLWGRTGRITIGGELRFWSERTLKGYEARSWHTVRGLPRSTERRSFFEAFANAVLDGGEPPVLPEEARQVQAVIEAAYRSAESGRSEKVFA